MAKQGRAKKQCKLGTGEVTPKQIAYIIYRYLSDNSYSGTLSSFRAEASDLLPRTYSKEVPKGLMGLSDILNDYICLKKQRLQMDREKQRVDTVIHKMQDAIRLYQSETPESAAPSVAFTYPSQNMASTMGPLHCSSNPKNTPHLDNMTPGTSIISNSKPPLPPPKACDARYSAPARTQSYAEKRNASKSKELPSPKKLRTQPSTIPGMGSSSREAYTNIGKSPAMSKSGDNSTTQPPIKGLSVVKKLFKHPESHELNTSSPRTPPRPLASQMDKSLSPSESLSVNGVESCSLISSERIIISPLKNKGYYAVERSYQVTCSPVKTISTRAGKRENVKGRLNFENMDALECMETLGTAVESSTPSPSDVETSEELDFDIPDFQIFDGDFLSGLLVDFDQNEGFSSDNCVIAGPEQHTGGAYQVTDQLFPDFSTSTVAGAGFEGIGMQGYCDDRTPANKLTSSMKISSSPIIKKGDSCSTGEED